MLKKSEIVMIVIIIAGCILVLRAFRYSQDSHTGDPVAVITQNGKVIQRIDLNKVEKPHRIKISGDYHNAIFVEKGKIRFEKSDCPNLICIHTGWLTRYGDIAVCMPNKVIVTIEKD